MQKSLVALPASFNHAGGVSLAGVDPRKNRTRKNSVSRSLFQRVFLSIGRIRGGGEVGIGILLKLGMYVCTNGND